MLSRFAYPNPGVPSNRLNRTQSTLSRESSLSSLSDQTKHRSSSKLHKDYLGFTSKQLSQISKCVSCEMSWTTRKTSAQKVIHFKSCAKKKRLQEDTVRVLLARELDKAVSEKENENTRKKQGADARTLLDAVVNRKLDQKGSKKIVIAPTIKTVGETRDSILDKARSLLSNPVDSLACLPSTQSFGASALGTNLRKLDFCPSPTTEQASTMVRESKLTPSTDSDSGVNRCDNHHVELPPSTQAFSSSKLSLAFGELKSSSIVSHSNKWHILIANA